MNFFLIKWFIDEIKSGKPIMYYNIETTDEEEKKEYKEKTIAKIAELKEELDNLIKLSGIKD